VANTRLRERRSTVLVVEDEEGVRESVCDVLRSAGFEVRSAGDGAEALAVLGQVERIDAMVLDLFMPNLDGFGVLDALTEGPVVIVFSAFEYASLRDAKEKHGDRVCAFVSKPAVPADLVRVVAECLRAA
jgi:CheY-like chemotaxis protein